MSPVSGARAILHVDMDAFYASVEMHDRPELRGLPVIVGGTGKRGVVAAASYEVRRFGVHSAMPMREALARCPQAVCVAPRMERYREVSHEVFAVFGAFTPLIEGLSLDEAFLDVTASLGLFGTPVTIAQSIKARIRAHTGLTASVGVAGNKLLAKLASDLGKPDGLYVIEELAAAELLGALPVRRLSGIGERTAVRLETAGVRTFADLRTAPDSLLRSVFGRRAPGVRERAWGIDDRPVIADAREQQISSEETFAEDIREHGVLYAELGKLSDRTVQRLRAQQLLAGLVTVKIRRHDFHTVTRSRSFAPPCADSSFVLRTARALLEQWLATEPGAAVRLLGVGVGSLKDATQLDLFAGAAPGPVADATRLDPALDRIRERFGAEAIMRASSLTRPGPKEDGFTGVRRR